MKPEQSRRARRARRPGTRSSLTLVAGGLLAMGLALGGGCVGTIGDPPDESSCTSCPTKPKPGETTTQALDTSRFPRLSHLQWENSVQDLLHLAQPAGLSASFTGDPLGGIFDNNESSLLVAPGLWADYQLAAEQLSVLVTSDAAKLAKLIPSDAPADAAGRTKAFLESFGMRAYRRPLSPAELAGYTALFAKGKDQVDGTDDFAKGVRLTLQAFLQSPNFIYRVETSSTAVGAMIPLSDYELATKLSYMLWNTMPDDALFAAAKAGKLATPEGVLAQATRLLDDDRARVMVASFHHQLFQYDHYDDLTKDPTLFPDFTPALGADMKREAEMFVEDMVFARDGGIKEILTEPTTFVNSELAAIYGLKGNFGSDFVKVDLDPKTRSGILTRIGFLASNATSHEQHSIHRGVFINRRVICAKLPDPPNNVPPLPPAADFKTNRERVEKHTGAGTCGATCHGTLINPAGFAFEHYGAIGQYEDTENGNPVNSADTYTLDGKPVSYDNAVDFDKLLAESDQVHDCYAKHWLQYAYGRGDQPADALALADLAKESRKGARALILALTQTQAFRSRMPHTETP
jgi:uncharacterized protein DUF1592/uncharacterized protein DUF1588/uncharacterized protein DUF1595/uncharacterized protein DUF1585/uncharacterized protein DUF1587